MATLSLMRRAEEAGLVAELLLQSFRLLVDLGLSPPSLLLLALFLLLFVLEELQGLALLFLLASPSGLLSGFGLAFCLALLGLHLSLQARRLRVNLPLCTGV